MFYYNQHNLVFDNWLKGMLLDTREMMYMY